jgi:hypothetical protein
VEETEGADFEGLRAGWGGRGVRGRAVTEGDEEARLAPAGTAQGFGDDVEAAQRKPFLGREAG